MTSTQLIYEELRSLERYAKCFWRNFPADRVYTLEETGIQTAGVLDHFACLTVRKPTCQKDEVGDSGFEEVPLWYSPCIKSEILTSWGLSSSTELQTLRDITRAGRAVKATWGHWWAEGRQSRTGQAKGKCESRQEPLSKSSGSWEKRRFCIRLVTWTGRPVFSRMTRQNRNLWKQRSVMDSLLFLISQERPRYLKDDQYPPRGKQVSKHGTLTQLNIEQILKISTYMHFPSWKYT